MRVLLLCAILISYNALADNGKDRIRTQDGAICESSVDTGKRMYTEFYTEDGGYDGTDTYGYNRYDRNELGVKIGLEIQLDQTPRLDCQRLYDLELRDRNLELKLKEAELELKMISIQEAKHRLSERKREF